ncbi:Lar family restriction alleviation protein, partial [Pseudomonas aeruginosa]|nr:Lar family restriction alleviation protein [Pseudomonas aeruginosa]
MTESKICTCPSGDGSLVHPCPAHIGPFDKLVGSPVHNESEPDLPPLDEHLAQVFETGMALSESVEQAGGDERDLQAEGAQGELLPCPFCGGQAHLTYDDYVHDDLRPMPVVECNACHTWVRAESWNKRAALAQPSPGQAEAERAEVVAWRYGFSGGIVSDKACLDEWKSGGEYQSLMTVAQHERIVGELRAVIAQLRQHKNDYMDAGQETYRALQNEIREREAEIARLDGLVSGRTAERDAALARV